MEYTDSEFAADLDLLKARFMNSKGKGRERIRNLISACLNEASQLKHVGHVLENQEARRSNPTSSNPLDIDLICENVFRFLSVQSLVKCRPVSRHWNTNAIPWIQKKKNCVRVSAKNFPQFCADFENAAVLPFRKLAINLDGLSVEHCIRLFSRHGSALQELNISRNKYGSDWSLNPPLSTRKNLKKLKCIFRTVHNLKKLALNFNFLSSHVLETLFYHGKMLSDVSLDKVEYFEISSSLSPLNEEILDGLFGMLPNVRELQVGEFAPAQDWELFVEATKKLKLRSMRFPELEETKPASLWRALAKEDAHKLEQLTIYVAFDMRIYDFWELIEAQQEFLKSQSNSLQDLRLIFKTSGGDDEDEQEMPHDIDEYEFLQKLEFPLMKNLRSLDLNLTNFWDGCSPILPIDPKHLPNLRSVRFDYCILECETRTLEANSVFPTVLELDLNWEYEGNQQFLPQFAAWFPNLKKLTNYFNTFIDDETVEIIVTNLPNIEELEWHVKPGWRTSRLYHNRDEMTDYFNLFVSGFTIENGPVLSQLGEQVGFEALSTWIKPQVLSLRDLKSLKRLLISILDGKHKGCAIRVDEIGLYLAFLSMSPGVHLTFEGDFLISEEIAAKLTAHFQTLVIKPWNRSPNLVD